MLRKLIFAFLFINFLMCSTCGKDIYNIVAPATIHSNYKYKVAVAVHEANGPCKIEIKIASSSYSISKTLDLEPMTMKNIEFTIPNIKMDDYKLMVKGISGISIENSTNLNYAGYNYTTFVQTDKSYYAPGDLVQYRVIFLDEYAQPAVLREEVNVVIYDDTNTRIEQFRGIKPTNGIFAGNFTLADLPINEQFQIGVFIGKNDAILKPFGINENILPKFDVLLNVPKNIPLSNEVLRVGVISKYTAYPWKPVKGTAHITIINNENLEVKKSIPLNGKAQIEFDILKDLPSAKTIDETLRINTTISYKIYATVEEDTTAHTLNSTILNFNLHRDVMLDIIEPPKYFYPEKSITYIVAGKNYDGSPTKDNESPVELIIQNVYGKNLTSFSKKFDDYGNAIFDFQLPMKRDVKIMAAYRQYKTNAYYLQQGSDDAEIKQSMLLPDKFQLIIKTKKPTIKSDLIIQVQWTEPINYFLYIITARGNIIQSERIEVPITSRRYNLKITPTFEMIPEARILVEYIYDANLRFVEETLTFAKGYQNTLSISTVEQACAESDIEFKITTDSNSYVGLLAVDQSTLRSASDNDIYEQQLFTELLKYKTETTAVSDEDKYPGKLSGLITLTNARFSFLNKTANNDVNSSQKLAAQQIKRGLAPVTWFFDSFQIGNQTEHSFLKKIPRTITTWAITGFSLNPNTGIALTKTKVKAVKALLITINLPHAVKLGEVISMPAIIFNYMHANTDIEVIMESLDNEFEFVEAISDFEERTIADTKRIKRLTLEAHTAGSISFLIKPIKIGLIKIKLSALAATAKDNLVMELKVEPKGVTQYKNMAYFINLNNNLEKTEESITIDLPDNVVPNTAHIEFTAIGDLFALTFEHMENLIRLPNAYGEQNFINFAHSALVLKYLKTINRKLPEVNTNALNILKINFQRLLNFRLDEGSYSAYAASTVPPKIFDSTARSTWLTAYVGKYLRVASEFLTMDWRLIPEAMNFLASKQTQEGNFAEYGGLYLYSSGRVAVTAFVLLTFLEEVNNADNYKTHIDKGVEYLVKNLDYNDTYSLSIAALVLQKVKHSLAAEALTKLKSSAQTENGLTWWSADSYGITTEITSYALLAMLENGLTEDVYPVIKWLVKQRNSNGGLLSTQDTIVSLQAFIKFGEKMNIPTTGSVDIDYTYEDAAGVNNGKGTMKIVPENAFVSNVHKLPPNTRKINFTAKGNSSFLAQLSYSYNTIDDITAISTANATNQPFSIDLCADLETTPTMQNASTNLYIIEATLPSGYTFDSDKIKQLRDFKTVLYTETKNSNTKAIIYFDRIKTGDRSCVSVDTKKSHAVGNLMPATIVAYDYYVPNNKKIVYYQIRTSLCGICVGVDCTMDCRKSNDNDDISEVKATIFEI